MGCSDWTATTRLIAYFPLRAAPNMSASLFSSLWESMAEYKF